MLLDLVDVILIGKRQVLISVFKSAFRFHCFPNTIWIIGAVKVE